MCTQRIRDWGLTNPHPPHTTVPEDANGRGGGGGGDGRLTENTYPQKTCMLFLLGTLHKFIFFYIYMEFFGILWRFPFHQKFQSELQNLLVVNAKAFFG